MPRTIRQDETSTSSGERLEDELTAVEAIYPGQVKWLDRNREFVYTSENGEATLVLRLPDDYLDNALPDVILANSNRVDLRGRMREFLRGRDTVAEQLDAAIDEFRSLVETVEQGDSLRTARSGSRVQDRDAAKATVVVWLHHLLDVNKRKQVLSPASAAVSGYSKPGYPGILLFTGDAAGVRAHVHELKSLNWQAFQVRLETDVAWSMPHAGMIEVEGMGDIISGLAEENRQDCLSAILKI